MLEKLEVSAKVDLMQIVAIEVEMMWLLPKLSFDDFFFVNAILLKLE